MFGGWSGERVEANARNPRGLAHKLNNSTPFHIIDADIKFSRIGKISLRIIINILVCTSFFPVRSVASPLSPAFVFYRRSHVISALRLL